MKYKIKFYITNFFNLILGFIPFIYLIQISNINGKIIMLLMSLSILFLFNIPIFNYSFKKLLLNTKEYDFKSKFIKKKHIQFHSKLKKEEEKIDSPEFSIKLDIFILIIIVQFKFSYITLYFLIIYIIFNSVRYGYIESVKNHFYCSKNNKI